MSPSRRDFLKTSLGVPALVSLGRAIPGRSALAGATRRDDRNTILVVVQLTGGNDGLNTVVPYADDAYASSRPTLALPANQLHKIDSQLGFHPRMEAFMRLFKEGRLSVVQGVAYPKCDRTHEKAMRNWQTARPGETTCQTGWLGRTSDVLLERDEGTLPAVFVGRIPRPFTLNAATAVVPSIRSMRQCVLATMPGVTSSPVDRGAWDKPAERPQAGSDNRLLDFVRRSTSEARTASKRLEAVIEAAPKSADYPAFLLAQTFRGVAQLIRAELGIRIYCTELGGGGIGGFDNHANQLGNHCAMLQQLSESVAAFVDDLARDKLLDRVLLITFSEFGRTVSENGRRGTGHGAAAPMFLAGGKLKGGLVGPHPSLTDLDNDALKFHTDFRQVYATVLDRWLGVDSRTVLGEEFKQLDILQS